MDVKTTLAGSFDGLTDTQIASGTEARVAQPADLGVRKSIRMLRTGRATWTGPAPREALIEAIERCRLEKRRLLTLRKLTNRFG